MLYTTNLNLKKPESTDTVNVEDFNGNADILDAAVQGKVDKVAGKGLSQENYTTAEKTKLAGIAAGANQYVHPNHTGDVTSNGDGVTAIAPGVIVNADINASAAIDATKIAGGTVDNTEFGYLNGVTGSIQAQLDAKSAVSDYIRQPGYAAATGSANAYAIALSPALAAYDAGVCVAVKIPVANTGASTLNVNGLGAKAILDSKGNAMTAGKLKTDSIYTLRYNGTAFIVQGEGGEYGNAGAAQVLNPYTIGSESGIVTGTMTNNGALGTITPGTANKNIPAGYTLGGIVAGDVNLVSGNIRSGASIFGVLGNSNVVNTAEGSVPATAAQILVGRKAFVNGESVTGSIPDKNTSSNYPATDVLGADSAGVYIKPQMGFYSPAGSSTVQGSQGGWIFVSDANFSSSNIKNGVKIFGVTGTYAAKKIASGSYVNPQSSGIVVTGLGFSAAPQLIIAEAVIFSQVNRWVYKINPLNSGINESVIVNGGAGNVSATWPIGWSGLSSSGFQLNGIPAYSYTIYWIAVEG
ncbi:MAG: hypothetical protein J7559_08915 [Cohnella sp.]|nr:hypothetical protein [Cohnella sp.]